MRDDVRIPSELPYSYGILPPLMRGQHDKSYSVFICNVLSLTYNFVLPSLNLRMDSSDPLCG